jgi:DNA-binding transcriptional LysR family regulator
MTDIRSLDLNLLRAFSVLLVERNVTRAAKTLHVTQPTVSGMLARLRLIFEDPLFVRTSHGLLPTPRALELEPAVLKLIRDAEALVSSEVFDPASSTTTTIFSVNDYMQSVVMVPLLANLRSSAPNMKIGIRNLEVSGLPSMLMRGDIDMAITIPEFADDSLCTQFLYTEKYVAVVRASHPIRSSRVSLKRFLSFDHLLVSPADGSFTGPADKVLEALGEHRRVAVSVPSFHVLTEILREDDFIAFLPGRLHAKHAKELRTISAPIEVPGFDVIVAWHPRTNKDPAHMWLRTRLDALSGAHEPEA